MKNELILNRMDYWECPSCNLQLQILYPNYLGVLPNKGNGDLKNLKYKDEWGERILLKPGINGGVEINSISEFTVYLLTETEFRYTDKENLDNDKLD
jgi:hypothetical protein